MESPIVYRRLLKDTKFKFHKNLGEGANGRVVSGLCPKKKDEIQLPNVKSLSKEVSALKGSPKIERRAIKIFQRERSKSYWRERRALERLEGCKNVVQMDRGVTGLDQCYIIMEECLGDLLEVVGPEGTFSENDAKACFVQMMSGILAANFKGICHHDVKLENFLIGKDGEIKLSDFGMSVHLDQEEFTEERDGQVYVSGDYSAGSPLYCSPQILFGLPHSPEKTDIFGLGVCLYKMLCGRFPYCRYGELMTVLKKKLRTTTPDMLHFPEHLSKEARELLKGMLDCDEQARWGWVKIAEHSWL